MSRFLWFSVYSRNSSLPQENNIKIDDASLQKYVRQYENVHGVDYMKLWQRIETLHGARPGTDTEAYLLSEL